MLSDEQAQKVKDGLQSTVDSLPNGAVIILALEGGETFLVGNDIVGDLSMSGRNAMAAGISIAMVGGVLQPSEMD